ncbi:MAG: phospholipase D-like domain-containing protein [Kofleriaceae bacterium]
MRRALLLLGLIACRSGDDAADDQPGPVDAESDGPDGYGCTALTPRMGAVQTFVGPDGLQDRLATLIDSATTSLDVQMYLFTVKDLAQHITSARTRGVRIRVILDPDEAGNNAVEPILTSGGVPWKNAPAIYSYSHAKYLIIDRQTAVIMSMNFNATAMTMERNYGFVDRDPEDVTDLQAVFEQDWALANAQQAALPDFTCTRLIISPVNSNQRILEHIASATRTLDIEALYITDAIVRNYVAAAADRGVVVRVILEDPNDTPDNAGIAAFLMPHDIPVKYAVDQFYLHAKLIIADGVAFVGSENFSPTSLTQNREIGALITEADQVVPIQAQFDADWAITTPAQ